MPGEYQLSLDEQSVLLDVARMTRLKLPARPGYPEARVRLKKLGYLRSKAPPRGTAFSEDSGHKVLWFATEAGLARAEQIIIQRKEQA